MGSSQWARGHINYEKHEQGHMAEERLRKKRCGAALVEGLEGKKQKLEERDESSQKV